MSPGGEQRAAASKVHVAPGKIQRAQRAAMLNSRSRRPAAAKQAEKAAAAAAAAGPEPRRGGTRGYRAPEVLLGCTSQQTTAIDIWSAAAAAGAKEMARRQH